MNTKSTLVVIIYLAVLCSCGGSGKDNSTASPPNTPSSASSSSATSAPKFLGSIQSSNITSTITGANYSYRVYLPYKYESSTKNYPVIYCTDGQFSFSVFSDIIDRKNKDVIFVGISDAGRRAYDFVPIGAPSYMNFFKSEFVPLIESQYRTNHERTYVGFSLGGLLGSQFLNIEPVGTPFFKNYMLIDGSFWALTNNNIQDEVKRFNESKALNINLILTSASQGNLPYVDTYQSRLESRHYEGLNIYRRFYQLSHEAAFVPSFEDTIDLLY